MPRVAVQIFEGGQDGCGVSHGVDSGCKLRQEIERAVSANHCETKESKLSGILSPMDASVGHAQKAGTERGRLLENVDTRS